MEWQLRTRAGVFWIKAQGIGRFLLCIGDEALGSYGSPRLAAGDVHTHTTGHDLWDGLGDDATDDIGDRLRVS